MTNRKGEQQITLEAIQAARDRVVQVAHHTPLILSQTFSTMTGARVFLKAENLQRTGSFKIRGAVNKLATLSRRELSSGVIAASAGNHAQGVALAARHAGIPPHRNARGSGRSGQGVSCTIVMPKNAPLAKVEATKGYGARVLLHGETFDEAQVEALRLAKEQGLTFIPAFDDAAVIEGQGTLALEVLEDLPEADLVVVPVGGGGLIAGVAVALKKLAPHCRVVGVQAEAAPACVHSFREGKRLSLPPKPSIADGIAIGEPGALPFTIIRQLVDDLVTVTEEEIAHAMVLLLERNKLLVEGAGATSLAALLSKRLAREEENAVLLLTGGNVDATLLARILEHGLVHAGRYLALRVVLPDRPGRLAHLLETVAEAEANVVEVAHHRRSLDLLPGLVQVEVTVETRNRAHGATLLSALLHAGYRRDVPEAHARPGVLNLFSEEVPGYAGPKRR